MPISMILVKEEPNKQLRLKFSVLSRGVVLTPDEAVDVAIELLRAANALDASVFEGPRGDGEGDVDLDYVELRSFVEKTLPQRCKPFVVSR